MRKLRLAFGTPVLAIAVLAGLGVPAGSHASPAVAAVTGPHARTQTRAPAPPKPPKGRPEFDATFSGSRLNTKVWATCYPWQDTPVGCTNYGARDKEWYLPSQVQVSGGVLHLVAKLEPTQGLSLGGAPVEYGCRSGMITTYPSLRFKYGFVQVVAKIPHDPGLWPALWLAAASKQIVPEIDMIESWGVNVHTSAYYHPVPKRGSKYFAVKGLIPIKLTTNWQTYTVVWTKSELKYYVGGTVVLTIKKQLPEQPMYFIADLAEYATAVAPNCSGQLLIRSVKVWKA
jgi:beta-glucanase (GH16 family)